MDNPGTLETQDTRMETNETNQKQHRNVNRTTPKTGINPSARDQQFLSLITHPSCYSYIQPSPVKVVAVIEENDNIYIKRKRSIFIFHNGQPHRDDDIC